MSAQRRSRVPSSGARNQPQDKSIPNGTRSGQRGHESDSDWAERQSEIGGQPSKHIGSPTAEARGTTRSDAMPRTNDQAGSRWNQQQDPEHPERSADGGQTEMRGNSRSNEQPSGDPESPDQPESGDRGRHPDRRREES